jgi:hypothetical protein
LIEDPDRMHIGKLRFFVLIFLLLPVLPASAQNEEDALRISKVFPGGTGRSTGLANAYGAIGADPASIAINPAGFGLYRTSDLSLTPSFEVNDARANHYGREAGDTQNRFFFNNLALVLNNPSEGGDWRSGTFGVVYDRQASHHWQRVAQGDAVPSTIVQSFVNEAQGTFEADLLDFFPFTSGLAWETYAIDPFDSVSTDYFGGIPMGSPTDQLHTIESSGASNNTSFFYAGNYLDVLYIGASVGISGHRFKRTTIHRETSLDENLDLKDLSYREDLNTTGNGLDVKLGIIGRVTERFRLGASYHSPQWMQLNDAYFTEMTTRFRSADAQGRTSYSAVSPDGLFSYRVNTPWRGVLSAAYIAGANGLFSVDYEYVDYRNMRLRPSSRIANTYDFATENAIIQRSFRAVHSVRVGTEWRMGNWYYRIGWGFVPDAYVEEDARHGQAMLTFAGGVGYRTDHFALDLGLNHVRRNTNYFQYTPGLVDATFEQQQAYRAMVTVSFRP